VNEKPGVRRERRAGGEVIDVEFVVEAVNDGWSRDATR
jgi:hypothetical protein